MVARLIGLAACLVLATACAEDVGPSAGSEGGPCLPGGFCSAGLVCGAGEVCERAGGTGSVDAGGPGAPDGGEVPAADAASTRADAADMCVFPPSCQVSSDCPCPPPDGLNTCCFDNECGFHGVPCD